MIPSFTASAFPPTSVATTGRDDAIASMMALEKPSLREGRTKMSAAAKCCAQIRDCAVETDMFPKVQIPNEG